MLKADQDIDDENHKPESEKKDKLEDREAVPFVHKERPIPQRKESGHSENNKSEKNIKKERAPHLLDPFFAAD